MPCLFIDNHPGGLIFSRNKIQALHEQLYGDVKTRFEIHFANGFNYTILHSDGRMLPADDVHIRVVGYPRTAEWCEKVALNIHSLLMQCGAKGTDITFAPCDSPETGNILFYVNGQLVERSS